MTVIIIVAIITRRSMEGDASQSGIFRIPIMRSHPDKFDAASSGLTEAAPITIGTPNPRGSALRICQKIRMPELVTPCAMLRNCTGHNF
jgi:hypothetical protein